MNEIVFLEEKDKFKDNAICISIPLNLDETITDYNLIAQILKLGCERYQTSREIWTHLQNLYGAAFETFVSKVGERLIMNFYIQFIDNKYTLFNEDIFREAVGFLNEIINKPLIENNKFEDEYFKTEKENLEVLIKSRVDDKDEYAVERALELCCEGEPYALFSHGDLNRLKIIKNHELVSLWVRTLKCSNKTFYLCGNFDIHQTKKLINFYFKEESSPVLKPSEERSLDNVKVVPKEHVEECTVSQGKLCICYRTDETVTGIGYPVLDVLNSLLGGGMHSKLFKEVRERHGLAYYCYSFFDKFKGLLVISAGIDFNNYCKAKDIILQQIENIRSGKISESEFISSKNNVISGLKKVKDSQFMLINYLYSFRAYGVHTTIEDAIGMVSKVSMQQIIEASKKLELSTVYFLRGTEEPV